MGADKYTIFQNHALENGGMVLDFHMRADMHVRVDVHPFTDIATFPDMRVFANMRLPPDARGWSDVRDGRYFRLWVNEVTLWHFKGLPKCIAKICETLPRTMRSVSQQVP